MVLLTAALGVLMLGGAIVSVSHLIQPLSIVAAAVAMLGAYIMLQRSDLLDLAPSEMVNDVIAVVVSVGIGFLVYRVIGWALAALGFGTAFLVIVLFLAGGPVVFVYGYQLLAMWLVGQ